MSFSTVFSIVLTFTFITGCTFMSWVIAMLMGSRKISLISILLLMLSLMATVSMVGYLVRLAEYA